MDIVYKNTFTMTLERYLYFCDNPVGRGAQKQFRAWKNRNILGIVLLLFSALIFVLTKEWVVFFISVGLCAGFFYKLFFNRKKLNTKLFYHIRKSQDTSEWIRTTIFTDVIKVHEGNTESVYEYSYVEKITDDDEYYYLWHNSDFVFRLPKDSFIIGDSKEFKNYIIDRIFESRTIS